MKATVSYLLAVAAAWLPAQNTVVSPAAWTSVEGPSSNSFPFGSLSQQFRYLNVHDDLAGTARLFQSFALRKGATTTTTVTPPITVVLDGFMSTALTTGATVVSQFDANHGPDKAQVMTAKTISFPAAGIGLIPYPFVYQVPLDVPFGFAGNGPLCWEVRITSRPAGATVFHDAVTGTSTNPPPAVSRYGDGCIASGQTTPFGLTGGNANVSWPSGTGTFTSTTIDGPANAAATLLVGGSATRFGGLALPYSLPGTQGTASGPCWLLTSVLADTSGTLSSTGAFTFRVTLPLLPGLHGVDLYSQAAAIDPGQNALNVVTSNGVDHQVIAPYGAQPAGRVYLSGSLGASGTTAPGQTLIVQFTY
jgi:hypothetical protein